MDRQQNNTILLGALQALYHRIANYVMAIRLKSYRREVHGAEGANLARQLREYINQGPVTGAQNLDKKNGRRGDASGTPGARTVHKPGSSTVLKQPEQTLSTPRELASNQPTVGDKLMRSSWDHLHASIRYARTGDSATAKLHADILDNSLKEAAHYLDEQTYQNFIKDLGKELTGVTPPNE